MPEVRRVVLLLNCDNPEAAAMELPRFQELVHEAARRDCAREFTVTVLQRHLPGSRIVDLAELADRLYAAGRDFIDATTTTARRLNLPNAEQQCRCPCCGDAYCPRAIPVMLRWPCVSPAIPNKEN